MSPGAEGFARRVSGSGPVDLLRAAADIATDAYPAAELDAACATVRDWSARLAGRIAPDLAPAHRLRLLNRYFFDELGFHGNRLGYFDIDNSYLNRVVERRSGLPISLSVIYMLIGRAAGLELEGVSFPRRFLVKLAQGDSAFVIDVFEGGQTLTSEALRTRLVQAHGAGAGPLGAYLRAATEREILTRWLYNLKLLHERAGDWPALLSVGHRLVALLPDSAQERLDRAAAYEQLECPRAAALDLEAVLEAQPGRPDAAALRERLARLHSDANRLN
jgi:regulator of sirC expression with transglutaminase-like and TPR domain